MSLRNLQKLRECHQRVNNAYCPNNDCLLTDADMAALQSRLHTTSTQPDLTPVPITVVQGGQAVNHVVAGQPVTLVSGIRNLGAQPTSGPFTMRWETKPGLNASVTYRVCSNSGQSCTVNADCGAAQCVNEITVTQTIRPNQTIQSPTLPTQYTWTPTSFSGTTSFSFTIDAGQRVCEATNDLCAATSACSPGHVCEVTAPEGDIAEDRETSVNNTAKVSISSQGNVTVTPITPSKVSPLIPAALQPTDCPGLDVDKDGSVTSNELTALTAKEPPLASNVCSTNTAISCTLGNNIPCFLVELHVYHS